MGDFFLTSGITGPIELSAYISRPSRAGIPILRLVKLAVRVTVCVDLTAGRF